MKEKLKTYQARYGGQQKETKRSASSQKNEITQLYQNLKNNSFTKSTNSYL